MVLRKKETYTVITPIPGFIPRQLAIDILHSHREVITLNPLVTDVRQIKAPRDAPSDEFFSTWYEITERLQVVPGMGRLGSSTIKFNGCFHDMPWGLQSHIYAPLNIDMRNKYRVGGNQPGVEPPEPQEIGLAGLGAPKDGLYLREDIEFKCNITMVGVVRAGMKAASKEMIDRIIKKAELLDAGVLQAMIEDGKLRTINPGDGPMNGQSDYTGGLRAARMNSLAGSSHTPPLSPSSPGYPPQSQSPQPQHQAPYSPSIPYQVPRPISLQQQSRPGMMQGYPSPTHPYHPAQNPLYAQNKVQQYAVEMPANEVAHPQQPPNHGSPTPQVTQQQSQEYSSPPPAMELPGDSYWQHPPQPLQPQRQSHPTPLQPGQPMHYQQQQQRWSTPQPSPALSQTPSYSTAPTSDAGSAMGSPGMPPPPIPEKISGGGGYASELSTHKETAEETGARRPTAPYPY